MDAEESIDTLHEGAVSADVLLAELEDTVRDASGWAYNCQLAEDTSWCIWEGQTDDGLKHALPGDEEPPWPWENSSDTRIRLVEEKVRESTMVAVLTAKRGNWQFQGTEGLDFMQARRNSQLLRWQEARQIPGARRERNLFIYNAHLYGCAIMGLGWEMREEMGLRRVTERDQVRYPAAFATGYIRATTTPK